MTARAYPLHRRTRWCRRLRPRAARPVANYDSVATMEGGENIVKTALDNYGKLDIVVTPAGILRDRMVFNMTEQEWDGRYRRPPEGHVHGMQVRVYLVPAAAKRLHHHVLVHFGAVRKLRPVQLWRSERRHSGIYPGCRQGHGTLRRARQ